MKSLNNFLLFFLILSSQSLFAMQFYPIAETNYPVFIGAGLGVDFANKFSVTVEYGSIPSSYYGVIGQLAASIGGNAAYNDVVQASLQNNYGYRGKLNYYFTSSQTGWNVGLNYFTLSASGSAGIDKVLYAATGYDYTGLKTLLTLAGRSTEVSISSSIAAVEFTTGYAWSFSQNAVFNVLLGLAKIVASKISLKTGLPVFEASAAGNSLMRNTKQF